MARNNHPKEYAVIGLGRFGSSVARTLMERGAVVLGIDRSPDIVQDLADVLTQAVALDSTDEDALREIDIMSFKTVIVAIGSNFEANLMTTVALRDLGVQTIVCKALNERQKQILLKVGANRVVLPEFDAGNRLAQELTLPGVIGQLDLGPGHTIGELNTPEGVVGQQLGRSDLLRLGVTVLAVKRSDRLIVSPAPDFVLRTGDVLVVVGTSQSIERCTNLG
jgi:trk system potassium uptake protein TrkA